MELDPDLQYINGYKQFEGESFVSGGSHACGYSFAWGWKHHLTHNDCISVILDSDMFFIRDISFQDIMSDHNLAIIPSYRYSSKYTSEKNRG